MSTGFDPLYEWLGIPPDEQPPHCYRLLGLHIFEDNVHVIEHAADRHTVYLRTLLTGPHAAVAQELLNQVSTAKAWLLTAENKAQYDAWLKQQLGASAPPVPPVAQASPAVQEQEPVPDLADALGDSDYYVRSPRSAATGRRRRSLGPAISLGIVAVAVAAAGVAVFLLPDFLSETGTLVVQWPEEDRGGGVLEVDGKRVEMAPGAEIVCRLPMGAHPVKCTRPGFEPFEVTMAVTTGKTTTLEPIWREAGGKAEETRVEPSGQDNGRETKDSESKPPKQEKSNDFQFETKAGK